MGIGDITKQLAKEVVGAQKSKMFDSLRPADLAKKAEQVQAERPAAGPAENMGGIVFSQINAMQKACKEDQELMVLVEAAAETLRILEIFAPSWQLFVMTGIDADGQVTRIMTPVVSLQLVCKVVKVQAEAKPVRVHFIPPKPTVDTK